MSNEELIAILTKLKKDYLTYRGGSFDKDGNLLWAKDDAEAWVEGLSTAIKIITEDNKELFEKLGEDYASKGIPYWEII
jgi:hypothetical protein